jgi:D-alanine-D-alanine ligase-like ATP-grasp enzyme
MPHSTITESPRPSAFPILRIRVAVSRLKYYWKKAVALVLKTNDFPTTTELHNAMFERAAKREGLPVPEHALLSSTDYASALERFRKFTDPVVVKPRFGHGAKGVSVDIRGEPEFKKAFLNAAVHHNDLLLEEFCTGRYWRLTILHDELISAWERLPASVIGDGHNSIRHLVEKNNTSIETWDTLPDRQPIVLNSESERRLEMQGLNLDSVPEAGRLVELQFACNASLGGRTLDVTNSVHPSVADLTILSLATRTGLTLVELYGRILDQVTTLTCPSLRVQH